MSQQIAGTKCFKCVLHLVQIAKLNGIASEIVQPHWNDSAGQDSTKCLKISASSCVTFSPQQTVVEYFDSCWITLALTLQMCLKMVSSFPSSCPLFHPVYSISRERLLHIILQRLSSPTSDSCCHCLSCDWPVPFLFTLSPGLCLPMFADGMERGTAGECRKQLACWLKSDVWNTWVSCPAIDTSFSSLGFSWTKCIFDSLFLTLPPPQKSWWQLLHT